MLKQSGSSSFGVLETRIQQLPSFLPSTSLAFFSPNLREVESESSSTIFPYSIWIAHFYHFVLQEQASYVSEKSNRAVNSIRRRDKPDLFSFILQIKWRQLQFISSLSAVLVMLGVPTIPVFFSPSTFTFILVRWILANAVLASLIYKLNNEDWFRVHKKSPIRFIFFLVNLHFCKILKFQIVMWFYLIFNS